MQMAACGFVNRRHSRTNTPPSGGHNVTVAVAALVSFSGPSALSSFSPSPLFDPPGGSHFETPPQKAVTRPYGQILQGDGTISL
jgi:hypothetical protein